MDSTKLDEELVTTAVNTIKMLSVDAIEAAGSGHPGLPMGCADIAFILWNDFVRFNPEDSSWPNRDRFVLSAGHGSALLYSLLHLFGFDLGLDEIKKFRQLGSKTPGHPEFGHTPGVETTSGPLGQGFANGVGMALAERVMAAKFNKNENSIINHYTYGLVSDGDIMEGISSEAASIAGHLGLSKIIYIYDSNHITIEGDTSHTFTEDVFKRFEAYNWHVLSIDGYDHSAIRKAVTAGQEEDKKPTLIIARTHIGKGSPNKQNKASVHGSPLGEEEIKLTRKNIGWPYETPFYIPEEVKDLFDRRIAEGKREYNLWMKEFDRIVKSDDRLNNLWDAHFTRTVPENIEPCLLETIKKNSVATRSAGGAMMQVISQKVPALLGGSADLAPSNNTDIKGSPFITGSDFTGRNIHFGIREHAMGAILNGMALSGGIIPYGATFLVFSDYMRPAIRLAALMRIQVIYIFTHDSIFVGEDGPTHEPVEHLTSLRIIPGLLVIRPSDATETAAAWKAALNNKKGPTALIMSRQNLPVIDRDENASQSNLSKGAYVLSESGSLPEIILMASGSEVSLAMDVAKKLINKGINTRVVSFPSFELFDAQDEKYKESVLPECCGRLVSIEAGSTIAWHKYVGRDGLIVGIDRFGASAPGKDLANMFGFTVDDVLSKIAGKWNL